MTRFRPGWPSATRLTVLVADGEPDAADRLAVLLRLSGHHARAARGGAEATQLAEEYRPDVVILDPASIGVAGLELAYRLRRSRPGHTLVVVVSSRDSDDGRRQARKAGADLYLVKPVPPDLLIHVLDRFWETIHQPTLPRTGG